MSDYLDIENLLLRYGRWVRSGDGRVGYPRCAAFAAAIPAVIPDDAVADMADSEGERIGKAMMALKNDDGVEYQAIEGRFLFNMTDEAIGKKYQIGSRKRVYELRQRGYRFLRGWLRKEAA